jgi:hypothetical protein
LASRFRDWILTAVRRKSTMTVNIAVERYSQRKTKVEGEERREKAA